MLSFVKQDGWKVLELGSGPRHPSTDVLVDFHQGEGVDFAVNFHNPCWAEIGSDYFDVALCQQFSQLASPTTAVTFLKQVNRVLRAGGIACFIIDNADAQPGKGLPNTPSNIVKTFADADFVNIVVSPYSPTEMLVEATKPGAPQRSEPASLSQPQPPVISSPPPSSPPAVLLKPASERFDLEYHERYQGGSFIWDFPSNYLIAQRILERSPKSVLDVGCGRGYILKRIQDVGISGQGMDASRHTWLTRVCDPIIVHDATVFPWPIGKKEFDLCVTTSTLEHIPEQDLPAFMDELSRVSNRGLHAVTLEGLAPNHDPQRITLRTLDFWRRVLPEGHEVVDIREISSGDIPQEHVRGDGRLKINLGSAFTCFYGWLSIDTIDAENFARAYKYQFLRHDLRNGIPTSTGVVDCLLAHHFLEHLSYEEITRLLKECRRVIRHDGVFRIAVPNATELTHDYSQIGLEHLNEMNVGTSKAKTNAERLWSLLGEGHKSFLDEETLFLMLDEAGWVPHKASFRQTEVPGVQRILCETVEHTYGDTSLFVDATPKLG